MTKEEAILVLDSLSTWFGHERPITEEIVEAIKTLSKSPLPSNLEDAARKYKEDVPIDTIIYYCGTDEDVYFTNRIVDAFIAGAKWQKEQDEEEQADLFTIVALDAAQRAKEQMMKEAVEGCVSAVILRENRDEVHYAIIYPEGKSPHSITDKVRVIILPKEDSHE